MIYILLRRQVNAVGQAGLYKDINGNCEFYTFDKNTISEMLLMIKVQYKISACRTICTIRCGWDSKVNNMVKRGECGESTIYYNGINSVCNL